MNKSFSTLSFALAVALFCGGCAGTQDGRLTQAQGTGIGAVLGGLAGYAIGGEQGAVRGALIGGAGGFVYGTHIASQKAKYANAELWLDSCIAEANKTNAQASTNRDKLESRLAALQTRAKAAVAANNAKEIKKLKADVSALRGQMETENANLGKQREGYDAVFSDSDAKKSAKFGDLRQSVNNIDSHRAAYKGDLKQIAALDDSLDV